MTVLQFPHLSAINALPKGLLYPHQSDGVSFLISKGRAILGDDMGLGKTRQAIVGMQIAAPTGMILVVCPASLKLKAARNQDGRPHGQDRGTRRRRWSTG